MQVNLDCRKPCPQFGNFLIAGEKGTSKIAQESSEVLNKTRNSFFKYINGESSVVRKGLKQYKKELAKLEKFDVIYHSNNCYVFNKETQTIVQSFWDTGSNTGLEHQGIVRFPGRKLFARLFNPKQFLPYNLIQAAKEAKIRERSDLATLKAKNELFNA